MTTAHVASLGSPAPAAPAGERDVRGVGLGFRAALAREMLDADADFIGFVEVHPENYVRRGGALVRLLNEAAERWPVTLHGLTLSLASPHRHDRAWLADVRALVEQLGARWYSDHMCVASFGNAHAHDLLPMPRTSLALRDAVDRIDELQDSLGVPVAIENISYYAEPPGSEYSDGGFVGEVLRRTGAKLLLDVNNIYVNARNFGTDARAWLDEVPLDHVCEIHVAGHMIRPDGFRIDTHAEPICDDVYDLVALVLGRLPHVPVLLERDGNYEGLAPLRAEIDRLAAIVAAATEAP